MMQAWNARDFHTNGWRVVTFAIAFAIASALPTLVFLGACVVLGLSLRWIVEAK